MKKDYFILKDGKVLTPFPIYPREVNPDFLNQNDKTMKDEHINDDTTAVNGGQATGSARIFKEPSKVVTTEDGQYYKVIDVATGELPEISDKRIFTITTEGVSSTDHPHYVISHPKKFKAWLRPVSLSDLIREAYWQGERDKGAEFTDNERTYADANDYINSLTKTASDEQ